MSLTPAEQLFFETGNADHLTADLPAVPVPPTPSPNALDVQALAADVPAVAPAPTAPTPPAPAVQAPATPVASEAETILRQTLRDTQQELAELRVQKPAPVSAPAPEPAPDPSVDPLGALMYELKIVREELASLKAANTQLTEQQQQAARFQTFQQQVLSLRDEFAKTQSDFNDAYTYLRNARASDLSEFGYTSQQVNEALLREEIALSEKAIREAKNPASVIYDMAKRHGYTAKTTPPPQPTAPTSAPGPDAAAIARAQAAGRDLRTAPTSQEVDLTDAGLRAASEADLNRMVLNDAEWKKLTQADQYPL